MTIGADQQGQQAVELEQGSVSGISIDKGEYLIDTTVGSSGGLPVGAEVTYGAPASPTEQPAFTVNAAKDSSQELQFRYVGVTDENDAHNVQFRIFDATGSKIAHFSEETQSKSLRLSPNETLYVVVVINTEGLEKGTDLSGSFEVSTSSNS